MERGAAADQKRGVQGRSGGNADAGEKTVLVGNQRVIITKARETQAATARGRQDKIDAENAPRVSPSEIGLLDSNIKDEQTLREYPEALWDEELKNAAEAMDGSTGFELHPVVGTFLANSGRQVRALYYKDGKIFVRVDHPSMTVTQLISHEEQHGIFDSTPGLLSDLYDVAGETLTRDELYNKIGVYTEKYAGLSPEDAEERIDYLFEELVCDIRAGISKMAETETGRAISAAVTERAGFDTLENRMRALSGGAAAKMSAGTQDEGGNINGRESEPVRESDQ